MTLCPDHARAKDASPEEEEEEEGPSAGQLSTSSSTKSNKTYAASCQAPAFSLKMFREPKVRKKSKTSLNEAAQGYTKQRDIYTQGFVKPPPSVGT